MVYMKEAEKIFETKGDYVIVDVRHPEEYADGHIPGAINIVNENIKAQDPKELPDKNQTIYVYCLSGMRSKIASGKLVYLGYTNVINIGGIDDWTGQIEK